jgi:nucleotide-binding universal stress UspA family protein
LFNKILVALDGSEHADQALTVALDLATKYRSHLILLTVFQPVYLPTSGFNPSAAEVMLDFAKTQKKHAEQVLSKAKQNVKKEHPTLQITTTLVEGRPADMIIATAEDESVNLIVMGSRGLGGIRQLVLGSVSDRVADSAACPVLIVR